VLTSAAATDPRSVSARALESALGTGDLAVIEACTEDLLAADVSWLGSRGGACGSRDEVLTVLRTQLDEGLTLDVVELYQEGDQLLLHVRLRPRGGEAAAAAPWRVVLTLDGAGLIVHMQDYADAATARRDMGLRAAGPAAPAAPIAPAPVNPAGVTPVPPRTAPAAPGAVEALVPFVHVTDVDVSAAFYALLGFEVGATFRPADRLCWVALRHAGAKLMLALAESPVVAGEQAVRFYLYSDDLPALRDRLVTHGVLTSEIVDGSPGPRQEMRVTDPDGYCLMVAQIDPDHPTH
jgi:pyruvate dehydrogenase E2 component (dihydrolipoamide acetyltransferase)